MVKNKDDEDKCAPDRNNNYGTCYKASELFKIVKAYNKTVSGDRKIDIERNYKNMYSKYGEKINKYLAEELKKKIGLDQDEWMNSDFAKHLSEEDREIFKTEVFRPEGPSKSEKWLNTTNIDNVLTQYEKKFKDFKYLGTMPRDFQNHEGLRHNAQYYKKLLSKKPKLGMVYNTDKLGNSGEHWNALFVDLNERTIEFFDSYGESVDVKKEVLEHMDLLESVMKEITGKKITKKINEHRAQYKNSECGVYSMVFILLRLKGNSFEKVCKWRIPDKKMNEMRDFFFRDE